jgi:xylulokinase
LSYLLGIDLGTSSVKALLLSLDGQICGFAQEGYDISIPFPGYAEQDPDMWWEKTCLAIRKLISRTYVAPSSIKGIGFSGQMHGLVALNSSGNPLRPCIIWADQRTKPQVEFINKSIGKEQLGRLTLNPVATGFFAASLLWLKENEPDTYTKIHKVVLPKDYLRLKMTGEIGTDITDASSSLLFDTANLMWSEQLVSLLGLDTKMLPECFSPTSVARQLTLEAAEKTNLCAGIPVVYGSGDQPAQAVGNGIVDPGTVSVTIGTGGQVFTPIIVPTYDPELRTHTFCHAVPSTWNIMGATLSAGLSLNWLKNNILLMNSYDEMSSAAEEASLGSEGLIFLPYLAGERTPHMDPSAVGMFFGLTLKHNRADMIRAVMEGVIFSLKDSMDIFQNLNLKADRVIASGGGAQSSLWKQMMADVFGCDVYTSSSVEQAAMGAAILAGVGVGEFDSVKEACSKFITIQDEVVKPDEQNREAYTQNLQTFRELYKSVKHLNR